jgi:hypothetical protein
MGAPLPRPPTQPLIPGTQGARITEIDPVTALDEAITIVDERWPHFDAEVILPVMFNMFGPNLLARLAIERGSLAEVEIVDEWAGSSEIIDPATKRPVDGQLYRVVEP